MGDCCSICKSKSPPPTIFSVTGQEDLVDIEHERVRQAAIALNIGKGPVRVEGKFKVGFEKESFTRYKRHPIAERTSLESIPSIPENNIPLPMREEFGIPPPLPPPRRNSR